MKWMRIIPPPAYTHFFDQSSIFGAYYALPTRRKKSLRYMNDNLSKFFLTEFILSLSLSLFLHFLSIIISLSFYLILSLHFSIYLPISIHLSNYFPTSLSIYVYVSISLAFYLCLSLPSIYLWPVWQNLLRRQRRRRRRKVFWRRRREETLLSQSLTYMPHRHTQPDGGGTEYVHS